MATVGRGTSADLPRGIPEDAPVLILDEPTSSVDIETEAAIMATMEQLMTGRTTIMISHRPSAPKVCDAILELRDGGIDGPSCSTCPFRARSRPPRNLRHDGTPWPTRYHAPPASVTVAPLIAVRCPAHSSSNKRCAVSCRPAHASMPIRISRSCNAGRTPTPARRLRDRHLPSRRRATVELFCKYAVRPKTTAMSPRVRAGGVGYEAAVYSELSRRWRRRLRTSTARTISPGAHALCSSTSAMPIGSTNRPIPHQQCSAPRAGSVSFTPAASRVLADPALLRYDADHYRRSIRNAIGEL